MISPAALDAGRHAAWPLSDALPALGALPTAPAIARAFATGTLSDWRLNIPADEAVTVISELVTNAVQARSDLSAVVRVAVLTDGIRLRIEVWDQAPGVPAPRGAGELDENGRGLALVESLTGGRWGWYPAPANGLGKCVWAELLPDNEQPRS
jgi:serine/threonine-protein kinase RsbW